MLALIMTKAVQSGKSSDMVLKGFLIEVCRVASLTLFRGLEDTRKRWYAANSGIPKLIVQYRTGTIYYICVLSRQH